MSSITVVIGKYEGTEYEDENEEEDESIRQEDNDLL
jgi:hypothetical protein